VMMVMVMMMILSKLDGRRLVCARHHRPSASQQRSEPVQADRDS